MKHCPRCGRRHSGMCGIPSSVVQKAPIQAPIRRSAPITDSTSDKYNTLEDLLEWSQGEKEKVLGMFKVLSPDMEKYNQLVERLDRLESTIQQVRQQIANRRGD